MENDVLSFSESMTSPADPKTREWDVIVVGTGMGGGTLGFKLAQAGKRVLFLEKGKSHLGCTTTLRGQYAEMFFPSIERPEPKHAEILRKAGRWTDLIIDASGTELHSEIPFLGSGTGGSSALFGMAMERFSAADFDSHPFRAGTEESSLPDSWPIRYADLKSYYERAEELYQVGGSVDPLRQERIETYKNPPPLVASNEELFTFLIAKGFHPYQLPQACDFTPGCQNCQGFLCPKNCRNDSAKICVEPAIQQYGACLLESCEVIRIDTTNNLVSDVVCRWQGKTIKLRSKILVLGAGALQTPALLLRSSSGAFPNGLANSSGQVGKNLMRHYLDFYAVAVKQKPHASDNMKQIAFNDLHHGTVQSFGKLAPPAMQVATIHQKLRNSRLPILAHCFTVFKPIVEMMLSKVFSGKLILASIMEDLPYSDNAVTLSQSGDIVIKYQIHSNERMRIECFRKRIGDALRPYSFIRIKQAESNSRIAHVCGTCRSGRNPKSSVVDFVNCAHDVGNLFIVDSSFFPSSGGTNPALTVAANALRVADHIIAAWH